MPTYDYRCQANGCIVEVSHGMRETISTWGELCGRAGIDAGDTPAESPVTRLITGGAVLGRASEGADSSPSCQPASCCGGRCGAG